MAHPAHAPDLETSSQRYARRFSGSAGAYLLGVQDRGVRTLVGGRGLATAVDVGGGHGQLTGALLDQGLSVTVIGSNTDCLGELGRGPHAARIIYRSGDLLALPIADRGADLVISVRLMAHIDDWQALVAELCRVAARSVVIDYPTWVGPNALALLAFPIKHRIEGDTRSYRSFWPSAVRRAFAAQGFRSAATFKQVTAPMGLHRKAGSVLRPVEEGFRRVGLTRLIGNPVLERFDRIAAA